MFADTGAATASGPATDAATQGAKTGKTKKNLLVKDGSGLEYTVDSAFITVAQVKFIPVYPESLASVKLADGLQSDGKAILAQGPFVFDLMSGAVPAALSALSLPRMEYAGITLVVDKKVAGNAQGFAVAIQGDFTYKAALHHFAFNLKCGVTIMYKAAAGVFSLAGKDTIALRIWLDASHWLDSVDLGRCLDKGWISFDSTGALVVDDKLPQGCNAYEKTIRDNILNSGVLVAGKK
jgi:hypothetical protein